MPADPASSVRCSRRDRVAVLELDDGKANALSHAVIDDLHRHLDAAEKEAGAVLLVGRPGRFSGGFDLATMRAGAASARGLVGAGARLLLRLYEYPLPVAIACTGHAVAAGALVLLAADHRIGARGEFRIGLNEVAIGMTLPGFARGFARERLSPRHLDRATSQAELYSPEGAVEAGFLDRVVEPGALFDAALAEAARLAALPQPAFSDTKRRCHGEAVARMGAELDADLARLTGVA